MSVPDQIRSMDQRYLDERMTSATLRWQEMAFGWNIGAETQRSVTELGQAVVSTYPPRGTSTPQWKRWIRGEVRRAQLYQAPGTVERISKIFGAEPGDESANMAALVITNAMVFQDRLASSESYYQPVSAAMRNGRFSRISLLQAWGAYPER